MTASSDHAGAFERQVRALLQGFAREFPTSDLPVLFGGRQMTLAEVVTSLRQMAETLEAVHAAESALREAITERRRAMKGFRSTYGDAVVFLKHHLGKDNPQLVLFGIRPPKVRSPLSAEACAIARVKAAATRKARGTLGRRQRLELGKQPAPTLHVLGPDGQPLGPGGDK